MMVRLGDHVNITNGFAFKSKEYVRDGIRVLRITNVQKGEIVDNDPKYYPLDSKDQLSRYLLLENDLLMSLTGNVGRVGRVTSNLLPAYVNQRVCKLERASEKLDEKYFYYILNSDEFEREAIRNSSGIAQLNLSTKWVEEYRFPLPPLATQKKIAAILDAADAHRQKTKELIAKYDELAQSLFLEMFGDPVRNEKGWEKKNIRSVAEVLRDGPFGSNLKSSHYVESGIRVIRLQNIGVGKFIDLVKAFVTPEHAETLARNHCYPGDILIGTLGDPNLRACVLPSIIPLAINKADCLVYRPKKTHLNSSFAVSLLNNPSFVNSLEDLILGQTRGRISMGRLSTRDIILPPLDLQNDFALKVELIESQKNQVESALKHSESLFQSLLQKAFHGELK